jgi:capsular exopolysaccharide synthesis family protein
MSVPNGKSWNQLEPANPAVLGRGTPPPPTRHDVGESDWRQPAGYQSVISYWQLAWRNRFLILVCLAFGAVAGVAYVMFKTPRYRASITVELVGFNQSFLGMSQVDPQAGTDTTTASASNIQTQTRILTSHSILSRVQERMNMEITPVSPVPPTVFAKVRARIPFKQRDPLDQARSALQESILSVSAHGVPLTRLIEIQSESTSPEVAANFLNTLAAEHIAQNLAARSNVTQQTSQFMESQLDDAKSRLKEAGDSLRQFIQKSGLDFFPEQSTLADTKLRQLQADVSSIQADRIAKQARWELAKNTPPESLGDVLNDATLQSIKTKLIDLRRERAQLMATLMPEHIKVQRIQAQITDQEAAFEKEKSSILHRLSEEYQEALRREKLLSGAYSAQTRTVGSQLDKSSQYTALKRDVEMAQQVYTTLLQQSNQAALMALVPTSNIRVVDPAIPPSDPSSPQPVRDVGLWSFTFAGIGYGLLWLRETRERKKTAQLFDAPGRTRTLLGVPELGVIPSAVHAPRRLKLLSGKENAVQLELASWRDKSSLLAESFRQALTSILSAEPRDHSPVYVITSVGPGEGKTTLSVNLATAMASIGRRVLLIDTDLRRARLHTLFGLQGRPGLSDLLTSRLPLDDVALDEFLNPTEVERLWVMTDGKAEIEIPAALLFSPRVNELLSLLQKEFDCVLLDTPPVLPFPDARLWGKYADGVVLVVRAGITTKDGARSACDRFLEDGVPVLGTILNDWTPSGGSSRYKYYSHDYHTSQ